jgi:AhpD family alkylhydroperoxidase
MKNQFYKKKYSAKECYTILYKGFRTYKYMRKAKKKKLLSEEFISRIMLAVTEVNGCEICSYHHTEEALKKGMSSEEIAGLLSGSIDNVPDDESIALFFAQHYADTRGLPSKEAWERMLTAYGEEKALGILGAIRGIMIGNAYGIAYSAFKNRLKGNPIHNSSVGYELRIMLSIIPFVPIAFVHSVIASITNQPVLQVTVS